MTGFARHSRRIVRPWLLRDITIVAHDAFCVAGGFWFAALMILPIATFAQEAAVILPFAGAAALLSIVTSALNGVFSTRWRLASLTDFVALIRSAALLFALLAVGRIVAHLIEPEPYFTSEFRILTLGSVMALGAQAFGRIAFRYYRFWHGQRHARQTVEGTLFVGSISEADGALRAVEHGVLSAQILGCLVTRNSRQTRTVRGCRILGDATTLEDAVQLLAAGGQNVRSVLVSPRFLAEAHEAETLKRDAMRLPLKLTRFEAVAVGGQRDIHFEDFLFRRKRQIDDAAIRAFIHGKRLLITGGGGSIGGDIAETAAAHGARAITLLDISEAGLQARSAALRRQNAHCAVDVVLCDVRDAQRLSQVMAAAAPNVVIHAAALKHIDLVEQNWPEGVRTNVFGTRNALDAAIGAGAEAFVNISTDKAADPVSFLGLTKSAAERVAADPARRSLIRSYSVRFGNVLGSSGSVLEVFMNQIKAGGPVTLTHDGVTRYFMSRSEAAELVLASGSLREESSLYLLDMGEPISIRTLAVELIEWMGLRPDVDIPLRVIGLRPGERLTEQLISTGETLVSTAIPGIHAVQSPPSVCPDLDLLRHAATLEDADRTRALLSPSPAALCCAAKIA